MDAVKFIEERRRMYRVTGKHAPTLAEWIPAEDVVKEVEAWSAAHPRKTRQSVFLAQYPEGEIVQNGCVLTVEKNFGARSWSDGNFENRFPAADGSRCAGKLGGKYRQQGKLGYQFAVAGCVPAVYCADSA